MDGKRLERCSSAVTLSDMEIFVFPELMYSLVLANILSPRIWRWRDDPWFTGIERMKPYRRIQRLKQYVMDHYVFNLDLDTWGLTRQEKELARFAPFLSQEVIAQSNALFGYQGDTYYFDIDIRSHFGLDKYGPHVIPYWKTETVEAMDAFRYREGFTTGAGECVSLAALYAAALFIVARIPLEDLFLMATPLHSQNFLDWEDGVLFNNRRLVTKTMWFNGTQISSQARRALENERVTIVSHPSGWIHTVYGTATIDEAAYARFGARLSAYLKTPLTSALLVNFFSQESRFHEAREALERYLADRSVDFDDPDAVNALRGFLEAEGLSADPLVAALARFFRTVPQLPDRASKTHSPLETPLRIDTEMTRDAILAHLEACRETNIMADMAFYAWRDLSRCPAEPFVKAAVERNPVSLCGSDPMTPEAVLEKIASWPDESIYDEPFRFAQPDEVWNFRRGDGWEKGLLLVNILRARRPGSAFALTVHDGTVTVSEGERVAARFPTRKTPPDSVRL
ncbi:MAG: hypothetical protein J6336_05640 [Kiritimatiellae bacterium]|nr:hypothetical protein [Kiritimatiellia bacterium]